MNLRKGAAAALLAGSVLSGATAAPAADVLIVTGGFYTPDLKNQLQASGNTVTEATSYTLASLASYDTVIEYGNTFVDQTILQTYVNGGGTLIWTPWAGLNFNVDAGLQVFANGGSAQFSTANPGVTVLAAADPLLAGVTFPAAGTPSIGRINGVGFASGVTGVANWANGTALLGYRNVGAGKVVGVNLQVITSDTAYGVINQSFASTLFNNAVNINTTAAVPEPGTWALMIVGLAFVGGALRRSKSRQSVRVTYA